MSDWNSILKDIDDDYLIGIANKGIVKRAYKDKEEGAYEVLSIGEMATVRVGDETVTVQLPLAESKCTCPSRSICRHVILGIIALKEHTPAQNNTTSDESETVIGEINEKQDSEETAEEKKNTDDSLQAKLKEELANIPLTKLRKTMGNRTFQSFVSLLKSGQRPQITYSSTITVQLPNQDITVKLLSPLEYATCTCHKKELCAHKAEAILWCKLEEKQITEEMLEAELLEGSDYDMEQVREAALQMKTFLEELFNTGLSRTSPDVLDYLERLAIISHNAKLAEYEGYWRALHASYGRYLKRMASFQVKELMTQLTRLYRRVNILLTAENSAQIARYAGEFKAQYKPVGNLDLIGIAVEHFESQAGYAGETVYFIEENTKEWYTYTSARPVFYDTKGRRGRIEKAQAPWGIQASIEEMSQLRIHLTGAKCDERRRLSSSQETKGEIIGDRKNSNALNTTELEGWYYQDFEALFREQIGKQKKAWLKEEAEDYEEVRELVFIRPKSFDKAEFSETEQKLYMKLYDESEREVLIEVIYSKNESWGIRYLERLTEEKQPCFLGKLYLRNGRMRLYPVTVFEKGEILDNESTV